MSYSKRAENGLLCALKAGSSFRTGACDSTQLVTRSLPKATLSRAFGEIANVLVREQYHATTVRLFREDQQCRLYGLVEERHAIDIRWVFLEISIGERPDHQGPPTLTDPFVLSPFLL